MSFTEPSLNDALAEVLGEKIGHWTITSEHKRVIRGQARKQPDIIVRSPGRTTVVIENEFSPASDVEAEASGRLGLVLDPSGEEIRSVIALVSDAALKNCRTARDARRHIPEVQFCFALHSPEVRFPCSGYLRGNIDDLVWFILHAGTPADTLERAVRTLDSEVHSAISILEETAGSNPDTLIRFARLLKQDFADDAFTSRKAQVRSIRQAFGIIATVMLNAMMYQQRLAESTHAVRNLARLRTDGDLNQTGVLSEWSRILDINYFSIFDLARNLLREINHPHMATRLVRRLAQGTDALTQEGVISSEDLSGVVFQRFITDRKYLATFYTRPQSAALLAHLAIPSRSEPSAYRTLRLADLACGTGTLIHAAYRRLAILEELAGGDPKADHPHMMAKGLTAADIVPSAAHLTASMLSSVYPARTYEDTRVLIPQYGRMWEDDTREAKKKSEVRLGSLELMSQEARLRLLLPTASKHQKVSGRGERLTTLSDVTPHASQDVVIMNPPFTRAGSDWDYEGQHVKQYRGLGTTKKEQQLMAKRQTALFRNTCFHGYAGLGSAFVALADKMIKDSGVLAFVLPLTVTVGSSWQKVRDMIRDGYGDLTIVSIADEPDSNRSFSADTGMAEVLLVAKKGGQRSARFVCLNRPLDSTLLAHAVAQAILSCAPQRIDGSLTGGTQIKVGDDLVGSALTVPWAELQMWNVVGIRDLLLAQIMHHLAQGVVSLPTLGKFKIPVCKVDDLAVIGMNDINVAGGKYAPFTKGPLSRFPIYSVLWNHDADRERGFMVRPDYELRLKDGMEAKAEKVWSMRSHAHFSRGTRFTSQSLTACFSPEPCLGGRAWPTVQMKTRAHEAAHVAWANSTLGCMLHWYWGNRQQTGRASFSVTKYPRLPTLDVRHLSKRQLDRGMAIVERFSDGRLLPMNEAHVDDARHHLDRAVLVQMLGLPEDIMEPLKIVRNRWCAEPSVHGGKKTRLRKTVSDKSDLRVLMAAEERHPYG